MNANTMRSLQVVVLGTCILAFTSIARAQLNCPSSNICNTSGTAFTVSNGSGPAASFISATNSWAVKVENPLWNGNAYALQVTANSEIPAVNVVNNSSGVAIRVTASGGTGVEGTTSGNGAAIYGANTSATGWSGYFNGRVYVGPGKIEQEAWRYVEPTGTPGGQPDFENSWINYDGSETTYPKCKFYKSSDGRVYLTGLVKSGTVSTGPTGAIFTLPTGYKPMKDEHIVTISDSPAGAVVPVVYIDSSGRVRAHNGTNGWFSLSNISFRAEQ